MGDGDHMQRPWKSLEGKVVMVTGASSGIGRELCLDLAKAGCRIVAAARRTDRLKSLCEEIERLHVSSSSSSSSSSPSLSLSLSSSSPGTKISGGKIATVRMINLDVTAEGAAIDASVHKAWAAFGRIDALVNNAGIRGKVHSPLDLPEEEWLDVLKTNLTGSWLVSKSVCSRMRDANIKGSLINISSITGLHRGQLPGAVAYIASKTGVNALTRAMALELGVNKIRINSIAPGIFRSEITEKLMQKDWLNKVVERTVPLRTLGTSDPALTSLVRYLIHDSSEYVTGNIFIVDAGATLPGLPIYSSL